MNLALLALGAIVIVVAILVVWVVDGKKEDKDLSLGGKVCPAIYAPVCGTNGKTYENGCHVPEGVSVAYQGKCS